MNKRQIKLAINTISSNIEIVTPAIAEVMLSKNIFNRKTSPRAIRSYSEAMSSGNWMCNGESIVFDNKGNLVDGQHRLKAVVRSGEDIVFNVIRGVKAKAFDTFNQGIKRSVGQIFELNSEIYVNGTILAATLKAINIYYTQQSLKDCMDVQFTPQLAEELRLSNKGCQESVKYSKNFKRPLVSATLIATLHYVFSKIDKVQAVVFLNAFLTGDCGDHKDILKLRNHFLDIKMNDKTKGMMRNRTFVGGVIIKAWNSFRANKKMHNFEYKKGEQFPKAI